MRVAGKIARSLKIIRLVQALPERFQLQVLEYIQTLRAEKKQAEDAERAWTEGALDQAVRGLDQEDEVDYSRADLKEVFS